MLLKETTLLKDLLHVSTTRFSAHSSSSVHSTQQPAASPGIPTRRCFWGRVPLLRHFPWTAFLGFLESTSPASLRGQIFSSMQHNGFSTRAMPSPARAGSQPWKGDDLSVPWKVYLSLGVNDCPIFFSLFILLFLFIVFRALFISY